MSVIIGRAEARRTLDDALLSGRAELVSVIGRRRVGKTYLIREHFDDQIAFAVTGLQNATLAENLVGFSASMARLAGGAVDEHRYHNWQDAFIGLSRAMESALEREPARRVLFFDELPWLAGRRSRFLVGFTWFWNAWAEQHRVVVVICGSAAAWMARRVIADRGGLHNRVTRHIHLSPFTLAESRALLRSQGIDFDTYQLILLYMALGGVPYYLQLVRRGESASQAIDRLCFAARGPLRNEFALLYPALFEQSQRHIDIVRALATNGAGLTRQEIAARTRITNGGGLTRLLDELAHSDFVEAYVPFGGSARKLVYRLVDEYSLFHLRFLAVGVPREGDFLAAVETPARRAWAGFAFESVCLRHVTQVKAALGIAGIRARAHAFRASAKTDDEHGEVGGVQIDLLLDRADQTITLIECKFSEQPFRLTRSYAAELREKRVRFKLHTRTRKMVLIALATPLGLSDPASAAEVVSAVIGGEELLKEG